MLNLNYVDWLNESHGNTKNCLRNNDDGSVDIIAAPATILITAEFLVKAPRNIMAIDGDLIVIVGRSSMICYRMIEESPESNTWYCELVKAQLEKE